MPRPRWNTGKTKVGIGVGLLLTAIGVGLALTVPQRFHATEAQANVLPGPAPIDGARAYQYLKDICKIGPRPAGSAANTRQRDLVAKHFTKQGATVREQPFTGTDPRSGARVALVNLIGSWQPDRADRVLLGVHYDTRPFPDEDRDPAKRLVPFLGANDGASGVALLMEIAHHLNDLPTPRGVDLVLFDGEELVYGPDGEYFLGSKEFARDYAERGEGRKGGPRYAAALVLDMIGDRDLQINQEPHSLELAPNIVRDVWSVARRLKAPAFRTQVGRAVLDDHLPLNNAGIPAIDIIDFDYPHWHTSRDLPEQCSAASLEQVGRVVTGWLVLPKPKRR